MILHIDSYGAFLGVKNALFYVSLKDQPSQSFSIYDIEQIILQEGCSLSASALALAAKHDIPVLFQHKNGKPFGRLWNNSFGSISTLRRHQMVFSRSGDGFRWVVETIRTKLNQQQAFLHQLHYTSPEPHPIILKNARKIGEICTQLSLEFSEFNAYPTNPLLNKLRGYEGICSKSYYQGIAAALPKPYKFNERTRRPAKDMFNCLLNYLFGILYGEIEGTLIHVGLDPSLSILHAENYNTPTLTFDCIEPYRVWADSICTRICFSHLLQPAHFQAVKDGIHLSKEGKKVALAPFYEYLQEKITLSGRQYPRKYQIMHDIRALRQRILKHADAQ